MSLPEGREAAGHFGTNGGSMMIKHGAVVIAAITSCTNTSNPSVMMAAGLLAKKAAGERACRSNRMSRPAWPPARAWSRSISNQPG